MVEHADCEWEVVVAINEGGGGKDVFDALGDGLRVVPAWVVWE